MIDSLLIALAAWLATSITCRLALWRSDGMRYVVLLADRSAQPTKGFRYCGPTWLAGIGFGVSLPIRRVEGIACALFARLPSNLNARVDAAFAALAEGSEALCSHAIVEPERVTLVLRAGGTVEVEIEWR